MEKIKPLKILIGNGTLALLAGSETWVYALAMQLKGAGHKVHGFAPELGIISKKLEDNGIPCFDNIATLGAKPFSFVLEEEVDHNYDVIIANHNHVVDYLRSQFPKTPIISTVHGIIHKDDKDNIAPEHPSLNAGVNQFVSVSEEIQKKLIKDYSIDSVIIRNFIDTKKFSVKRKINKTPQQILFNSNYHTKDDSEVVILREVAKHYGAKLTAVGMNFVVSADMAKAINDADIVVGMGRSVLEGVSAGRLGIVHGRWGTGGVISSKSVKKLRECNFSGRNSEGVLYTAKEIIKEIDEYYNKSNIDGCRNYIIKEHNVVLAAEAYIRIARELLGQDIIKKDEVPLKPYIRAKDVK